MNAGPISIVSKVLAFSLASISMLLVNKAAVKACPNTTLLMLSQNSLTLLIIWGFARCSIKIKDRDHVKSWTPCAIIFCLNIYSSSQALRTVTVQTFSVFRNVNTLITAVLEYITMGTPLEVASLLSIAMVIFGSIVYAWNDLDFNTEGYFWCILHICSMACYSILVKKTNDSLNLTAQEMSLYNNLISLPVFLLVMVASTSENLSSRLLDPFFAMETAPILYMSGIVAFAISVSAFWVQKAISPTAFILLNNANKIPALLLSQLLFSDRLNWPMVAGLSLSLAGACLYSLAARKLLRLPDPHALLRGSGGRTLRVALVTLALLAAALAIGRGTTRRLALRAAPRVRVAAAAAVPGRTPAARVKYDRALCTGLGDRLSVLLSVAALARAADSECLTYWCEGGSGGGGGGNGGHSNAFEHLGCRQACLAVSVSASVSVTVVDSVSVFVSDCICLSVSLTFLANFPTQPPHGGATKQISAHTRRHNGACPLFHLTSPHFFHCQCLSSSVSLYQLL